MQTATHMGIQASQSNHVQLADMSTIIPTVTIAMPTPNQDPHIAVVLIVAMEATTTTAAQLQPNVAPTTPMEQALSIGTTMMYVAPATTATVDAVEAPI